MPKTDKTTEVHSPQDKPGIQVVSTAPFKLKDRSTRSFQGINLVKQFGFPPETIIIEKVKGSNNMLVVMAVLTPEELAKRSKTKKPKQSKPGK